MKKITIYEYDRKNRKYIIEALEQEKVYFMSLTMRDKIEINSADFPEDTKRIGIDLTPFFRDDDRSLLYLELVERLIDFMEIEKRCFLMLDKRFTHGFKDLLYHRTKEVDSLEREFNLNIPQSNDVVSLTDDAFLDIIKTINDDLVGNQKFKTRLEEELKKYRVFNRLGYQPIFSVLICGSSGIGKTEVARILSRALSPNEPFIKINFGNYSDQNALSSLIGSPRGYIGSSKGELSEKLANSDSKIILIDEFEKSNKQVQNFFLQLLEDGVFTDSLGRDYDLNKYILVFTANLLSEKVYEKLSPELLSRFNLKYSFSELNEDEKKIYINKRTNKILLDVKEKLNISISQEKCLEIINIDCKKYNNMRDINAEIMNRISDIIYPDLH